MPLPSSLVDERRFRQIIAASMVTLAIVVLAAWILNPAGDEASLPEPLQGVFPHPGDTVVRQTMIEVDLPVGYSIELEIDGIPIPTQEIGLLQGTGRWSWGPAPGNLWEEWVGGEHTVTVSWNRPPGSLPDPGDFTWTFRVT